MSEFLDRISKMSPKRLALLAMELQEKVEALEAAKSVPAAPEPIAVIGLSCRFPGGADTPEAFWQLLRDGVDAISEIDPSRWNVEEYFDPDPDKPGKVASKWGGFLKDVDQFDPQFFGIAPREAMSMDPQQRLALEAAWEALENAGYAPDKPSGSSTGVFLGVCNGDYYQLQLSSSRDSINMYSATGNAHSVTSGRISYVLGLQGPSVSIDTACSSSAVAAHLAVQALRNGECRMALAGGVNLILSPDTTIALSRAKMMAPDGRCKAFDAAADGFVRSEGCGIVVLKRLSDAQADGDHILAVIRGSAINQDGRSNGLTAPNGPSQVSVIQQALANAGVKPKDVAYVETHGTGTSLGDPIEAQALGAALGQNRSAPLAIGSVKTNLGHTEAAAGVAGLIKVVLSLQHQQIPPHLHLRQLSPHITWGELPLTIPTTLTEWQPLNGKRIAGVSSFGFSGTNAHLILEEAPPLSALPRSAGGTTGGADRPVHILALSARSENALRELAARYASQLSNYPTNELSSICFTANAGRSHFNHRLSLVARDTLEAAALLKQIADGHIPDGVLIGQAATNRQPEVVFMFTGQGAQYLDMGRRLYETQPTFRKVMDRCDGLLRPYLGESLLSIMFSGQPPAIDETQYTQPALFAIEYALAELWRSWGIQPSAVVGHSVGEYVAACVAGVFSLEDGLKLIAERARLMASLPPTGEMTAVFASEAKVAGVIAPYADRVSIAAINWPDSVVVSGEKSAVQAVTDALHKDGIRSRKLAVSIASHSPLMEPILDAFEMIAQTVHYSPPQVDFVSGMTGQIASAQDVTNAGYWRRHLRQAVRFAASIETLRAKGYDLFVEVGPSPTLIGMAQRCVPDGVWIPSLRPGHDDWQQMLASLGTLYVHGVDVDWAGFDRDYAPARQRVPLPTYPFQRERYWFEESKPSAISRQPSAIRELHPLLSRRITSPILHGDQIVYESQLGAAWPAFLEHHRIFGMVVLPSPAYIEMVLAGAADAFGRGAYAIEDLSIHEALLLPEDTRRTVQLILDPNGDKQAAFKVYSQDDDSRAWTLHATGKVRFNQEAVPQVSISVDEVRSRCVGEISGAVYYDRVRDLGLEFGTNFRGITRLWRRDGEALGQIDLPEALLSEAGAYRIHPAFLDACFHLLGAPLPDAGSETSYLLIGMDRFVLHATPGARLWNHTLLRGLDANRETFTGDIQLFDESGRLIAEARGLHLKRATREALERITRRQKHSDWFYEVQWQRTAIHEGHEGARSEDLRDAARPAWLASSGQIADRVRPQFDSLSAQHGLSIYDDLLPALDALTAAYVRQALRQLGWQPRPGERVSGESLAAQLGIVDHHRRLFARLLEMLAEEGTLKRAGDHWEVVASLTADDPQAQYAPIADRFGAVCEAEVTLTGRCGQSLADVLRGQADPLHLLFPNGSLALTEKLYQVSPFARVYNSLVQQAIKAALAQLPAGRPLRVLEIGAGTGATTSYLLPLLPADSAEYVFSDISPLFMAKAEEKFRAYPFVRYHLLDIERDPEAQGFDPHHFDIVIAANVLHATSDLRQTLQHVQQLLAPGGLLVLLEGTGRQRWVDITFGLTEGWWRFSDAELRPDYPLLAPIQWLSLLASMGFADTVTLPDPTADDPAHQSLILAHAPVAETFTAQKWLILADAGGLGAKMTAMIQARGDECVVVPSGADYDEPLKQARHHVVDLRALDATSIEPNAIDLCADALQLVQATLNAESDARLWLVTRNAQPVYLSTDQPTTQLSNSPLWGLGRVIALEHPEVWGGLIDLDASGTLEQDAATLLDEIRHPDGEDQIAWRGSDRYVARLARSRNVPVKPVAIEPDAAYLITGGLGGLGLKVARGLAEQGAQHIVLIGRSGLSGDTERKKNALQSIEALGATVTVVAADVADRAQMAELFNRFGRNLPPLRGIVHAAVAMSAWPIQSMPLDALRAMLKTKVAGTWLLHELTREMELDFFVLFSSTTALWGSRELGHYAAANAFLDAFAHYRRALGLPALTINWGIWDEMRVASAAEQNRVQQFGLNPMPSDQALAIMSNLLGTDLAQIVVAAVDWATLKPAYEAKRPRPFLTRVDAPERRPAARAPNKEAKADSRPELLRQIEVARPTERRDVLAAHIRAQVANVLGIDPSRPIDEQQGLFEMGMDSLMSVELKSKLEAGVGRSLPSTLTFNYPSIAALTDYLLSQVAPPTEVAAPAQLAPVEQAVVEDHDDLSEDELAELLLKKLGQIQ